MRVKDSAGDGRESTFSDGTSRERRVQYGTGWERGVAVLATVLIAIEELRKLPVGREVFRIVVNSAMMLVIPVGKTDSTNGAGNERGVQGGASWEGKVKKL